MENLYKKLGVHIPEVLLPRKGTDLTRWSVVACDQYTSQPEYWQKVNEKVDGSPSTLKLTFPEIYLKDADKDERIQCINQTMLEYLQQKILEPQKPGFILVDRCTPHTSSRKGLLLTVDLECYDYRAGSQTLIRATEGTVLDRIPPRVKIRENAPIELPHIMLLIDDPDKTVIEKLYERTSSFEKLYDFELMQGGGHIKGWKVEDRESLTMVAKALEKLADPIVFAQKYGDGKGVLLFAAGDGNHSLATAKAHWENVKAAHKAQAPGTDISDHPARYALVEIVNVHDDGLVFEPIHRVLFHVDAAAMLDDLVKIGGENRVQYSFYESKAEMDAICKQAACSETATALKTKDIHMLPFVLEGKYGILTVKKPDSSLEVGTLQSLLDQLAIQNKAVEIDYIHGEQVVTEIGSNANCMGFYLPVMSKHDLFRTVILDGVLPRKTFSMGEAEEKRYYLECRKIR